MKLLKIYVRITEVITSYHLMLSKELYHLHEWSDQKMSQTKMTIRSDFALLRP